MRTCSPHPEQVSTLQRLIFLKGDTVLIARTGFGKSIVFHAYSVLTNKICLQITPLNKLGEEQLHDIQLLGITNPCLLTSETKNKDPGLISHIKAQKHHHILLSPEQAASKDFRGLLKDLGFCTKIGLVASD
jgi:superfamily II DNA helicase RecQ